MLTLHNVMMIYSCSWGINWGISKCFDTRISYTIPYYTSQKKNDKKEFLHLSLSPPPLSLYYSHIPRPPSLTITITPLLQPHLPRSPRLPLHRPPPPGQPKPQHHRATLIRHPLPARPNAPLPHQRVPAPALPHQLCAGGWGSARAVPGNRTGVVAGESRGGREYSIDEWGSGRG